MNQNATPEENYVGNYCIPYSVKYTLTGQLDYVCDLIHYDEYGITKTKILQAYIRMHISYNNNNSHYTDERFEKDEANTIFKKI